ncbi:hypothetical protein GCM10010116_19440 [Microbispora rosea subsp. aerata]|nr:hypothetical protein GCM10010116_19440 [Microbispora rosea subsp. aerata]GIH53440.1 hypothetical protein Mro02_03540 [Microbispora rosea subsp. aerata]GLJ83122.1 hypothetical protein GCM10017588_18480 [Microbispora rosea subsp. aerata]
MNGSTIVPSRLTNVPPNNTQNGRGSPPALDLMNPVLLITLVTAPTLGEAGGAVPIF